MRVINMEDGVAFPQGEAQSGYAVAIRLRRAHGIKQGEWAVMIEPHPDGMINQDFCRTPIEELEKGSFPDNTYLFPTKAAATEAAEKFDSWSNYYSTGDYKIFPIRQKVIAIYRGWRAG